MPNLNKLDQALDSLSYHKPTEEQTDRIEKLRKAQMDYVRELLFLTSPGREQSVALTQFEDSSMWAVKSIVLEKEPGIPETTGASFQQHGR